MTTNEPIAYLRDVGTLDDPCYVPCAKGDPGEFPVYGEPPPRPITFAQLVAHIGDALNRTDVDTSLSITIGGVTREVKFRAGSPYHVRQIELDAAIDDIAAELAKHT